MLECVSGLDPEPEAIASGIVMGNTTYKPVVTCSSPLKSTLVSDVREITVVRLALHKYRRAKCDKPRVSYIMDNTSAYKSVAKERYRVSWTSSGSIMSKRNVLYGYSGTKSY